MRMPTRHRDGAGSTGREVIDRCTGSIPRGNGRGASEERSKSSGETRLGEAQGLNAIFGVAALTSASLRRSCPSICRRSKATKDASAAPSFVLSASKSLCPSGLNTTASPSSKAVSTGKGPHRLRDLRQPVREVRPVPSPQDNTASVLAGKQPIAIVFDFVDPVGTGRGLCDLSRLSGVDGRNALNSGHSAAAWTPQLDEGQGRSASAPDAPRCSR